MTTYTSQPNETDGIDSWIENANTTTNYGTSTTMTIGSFPNIGGDDFKERGLIKFDLSIGTNPPSSYANVSSATLTLTVTAEGSSNTRTIEAYRVIRAWVEGQTTWVRAATGTNWGTAGCSNTTTDREASTIGTASIGANPSAGDKIDISLSPSLVQEWISGTFTNNGLLLKLDSETTTDDYEFASSNHATSSYRPKLVIEYTENYGLILMSMYERT